MTAQDDDGLSCCPEWCDEAEGKTPSEHGVMCPERPMTLSKGDFVRACEAAGLHAIDAYLIVHESGSLESMGDAKEMAVDEVREAAICRAGIGSCGRGWCDHG